MISKILTLLRKELNLTQEELADKLHIGRSTYGKYETEDRTPNIFVLIAIADFYNVSLDYLTGRTNVRKINRDEPKYKKSK